jgi:hypothetical protein
LAIAGVSSSASKALLPAAHVLLAAVGDMMGSRQPAPVREQATQVRCLHMHCDWGSMRDRLYSTSLPQHPTSCS